MSTQLRRRKNSRWRSLLWIGVGVLGLVIIAQLLGWMIGSLLWPLLVMAPGLFLFSTVRRKGKSAAWLTVPATTITMLGLMLFYQNTFNHWTSWSYGWPLLFPTSVGLGLTFYADLTRRPRAARFGEVLSKIGIVLFLLGFTFFELFLNISGILPTLLLLTLLVSGGFLLLRAGGGASEEQSLPADRPAGTLGDSPAGDPFSDLAKEPQERVW